MTEVYIHVSDVFLLLFCVSGVLSKKISEACGSDFLATCKAESEWICLCC